MSNQVIVINKPLGKTPLEIVVSFKEEHPEYKDRTISYAGRLDPMAHGLLLLLIGEENKNRENYLHVNKTYEVEILFGFETDTYDILGKVVNVENGDDFSKNQVEKELKTFVGKREQEYPPYSSKAVKGKPLFWWARKNKLDEIEIPKRTVEIFSIEYLAEKEISGKELVNIIEERIGIVSGNFRQREIIQDWQEKIDKNLTYRIVKIRVVCSSGTYMRTLAHELGKKLGLCAIAYDIFRTRVGEYRL